MNKIKRCVSLFVVFALLLVLFDSVDIAKAATTPFYYSCLQGEGIDSDCVNNDADKASFTLSRNDTLYLDGWVLSTVQFASYTVYLSRGSNPPEKTIEASAKDYPFPEGWVSQVEAATGKKYKTRNSRWNVSIKLSTMSTGTWNILVVGRVVGDPNSTYNIARVTLCITKASNTAENYAVCNDAPDPNLVHQYSVNKPNEIRYPNYFIPGSVNGFSVSGWAIHDRGIDSYSYRILDADNNIVREGTLKASNRNDLAATSKALGIARNDCTNRTGYSGSISIKNLKAGYYTALITGKTLEQKTFDVARISFIIYGRKAVIYVLNDYADDYSLSKNSEKIANQIQMDLCKAGYKCEQIPCGGIGNEGTTAAMILDTMKDYDLVFFTCHGSGDETNTPGYIKFYKEVKKAPGQSTAWDGRLTADVVNEWTKNPSNNFSKNQLIFIACCYAGKQEGKSVADSFSKNGAKTVICSTYKFTDTYAWDFSSCYFDEFALCGNDSIESLRNYYNRTRERLLSKRDSNGYVTYKLRIQSLRFIPEKTK